MESRGQLDVGLLNNLKGKNNARKYLDLLCTSIFGCDAWCGHDSRTYLHEYRRMKVTLEFDELEDAKRAIHGSDAWIALSEISELLRSQRKHDVPMEQTLICIQEIVQDTMPLIYS